MANVSSAELVPSKRQKQNKQTKKAVSVLKKATQIIIVRQNSLPFCIISLTPCVELCQTSAGDAFPSALTVREPIAVTSTKFEPFPLRLQTGPDGSIRDQLFVSGTACVYSIANSKT